MSHFKLANVVNKSILFYGLIAFFKKTFQVWLTIIGYTTVINILRIIYFP